MEDNKDVAGVMAGLCAQRSNKVRQDVVDADGILQQATEER
jgi:hypothetical protein